MNSAKVIPVALCLLAVLCLATGEETLSRADRALFDELQVTKDAREGMETPAAPLQPSGLPGPAAKMLGQLALYEASLTGITGEAIVRSRKGVSAKLIKLSSDTAEPAKSDLVALAKNIEGLAPESAIPAAGTGGDFPGDWIYQSKTLRETRSFRSDGTVKTPWSKGKWRWLNQSDRVVIVEFAAHN